MFSAPTWAGSRLPVQAPGSLTPSSPDLGSTSAVSYTAIQPRLFSSLLSSCSGFPTVPRGCCLDQVSPDSYVFFIEFMKCMQIASHGGFYSGAKQKPRVEAAEDWWAPARLLKSPGYRWGFLSQVQEEEEMVARGRVWVILCFD